MTVVPGLGGFGAGASVSALRPDGSSIGEAKTGADGKATVDFGTYDGPFILRVVGGVGVTYFNEKSGANDPFGAADILLSVVPTSTVASGAAYGVNPLTHMVAAAAGVSPQNPSLLLGSNALVIAAINAAKAQTYAVLGIPETAFDIFSAPVMVTSASSRIDASSTAGAYGLFLAELAKAATGSPLQQAQQLFAAMGAARSAGFGGPAAAAAFQIIVNQTAVATTALATGQSSFAAAGSALSPTLRATFSSAATTAASSLTASTGVLVKLPSTIPPTTGTSSTSTTSSTTSTTSSSTSTSSGGTTSTTSSSTSTSGGGTSTSTTTGGTSITSSDCTGLITLNGGTVFKIQKNARSVSSDSDYPFQTTRNGVVDKSCNYTFASLTSSNESVVFAGDRASGFKIFGVGYGTATLYALISVNGLVYSKVISVNVYLPDSEASGSGSGSGSGSASGAPFGG